MEFSTACPDWEERIVAGKSLLPPPLHKDQAAAALRIFKSLRVVDLPNRPRFGEVCRPWVFEFVECIFGAYNEKTMQREIGEFFLLISKKNGKSTIAAAIMMTALLLCWRDSEELLILAPTIEVAKNSYKPASDMVRADPQLKDLFIVNDSVKTITHRITKAALRVVAADPNTVGGKKAAFVLVDELWLFGKQPNADTMLGEATGGRSTKPEGFLIYLSTHSDEPPAGVFKDRLDTFRDIRDGKVKDNTKVGALYEFPPEYLENELYLEPENWKITNPNLNASVTSTWIQAKLDEASDPAKKREALAKWLNVEIGMNLRGDRWPGASYWKGSEDVEMAALYAKSPFLALENLLSRCEIATIGHDGGGLDDLAGLSVLGRLPGEVEIEVENDFGRLVKQKFNRWLLWNHAWCHKVVLERRKSIASVLKDFARARELSIFDDSLSDMASIMDVIKMVKDMNKLGGVGVDPAGLGDFTSILEEIGITQENGLLHGVKQGWGLMQAMKSGERALAKGLLKHCGGTMMPWIISNLKVEPTATAIRVTKQNVGDKKIDPAIAMFNAMTVMMTNPKTPRKSSPKIIVFA